MKLSLISLGTMPDNQAILDEINMAGSWFAARKKGAIRAKCLVERTVLTTNEGQVTADAGDFLCRGDAGDLWPQPAARLHAKYEAAGEIDADGWRLYQPRPDSSGVYAAAVPHDFEVVVRCGTLRGQPGDFLVKHAEDVHVAYPEDVWIVSQALFEATYEREPAGSDDE